MKRCYLLVKRTTWFERHSTEIVEAYSEYEDAVQALEKQVNAVNRNKKYATILFRFEWAFRYVIGASLVEFAIEKIQVRGRNED